MRIISKNYTLLFISLISLPLVAQNIGSGTGNYVEIMPTDSKDDIILKAAKVIPSEKQMAWQKMELTAFLHFGNGEKEMKIPGFLIRKNWMPDNG